MEEYILILTPVSIHKFIIKLQKRSISDFSVCHFELFITSVNLSNLIFFNNNIENLTITIKVNNKMT